MRVHGPPHVDGKLLGYQPGTYSPNANPSNPVSVWFHDACTNRLHAFTDGGLFPLLGEPGSGYLAETLQLDFPGSYTGGTTAAAVCLKVVGGALDCRLGGDGGAGEGLVVPPPEVAISVPEWEDLVMSPLWEGPPDYKLLEGVIPISLTYEEVECPCYMNGVVP